ncbi:MAG: benzoate/H(+) symporter BenE family transporter [Deltaproteobacteria bacterium]|jgi:benzoate membrane transport protein|nr:benzoate/H(+) symporter BenE family transporter [Deltaproteobacteria bacterium]
MLQKTSGLLDDFSLTAVVAGLLAVVVSFAGSAVIIFQAASLAGLSQEITSSWIWAVSIGSAFTGIWLSWRLRTPIITAWSTPGAALLVVMLPQVPFAEAITAYRVSALVIIIIGLCGWMDRIIRAIPKGICAGLFAGILFNFGANVFSSVELNPLLAFGMLAVYLLFRKISPRYCMATVMVCGMALCAATGIMHLENLELALAKPVFTMPAWSGAAVISLGLPLALINLTGQYISGMAVLRSSGYQTPAGGILTVTGIASVLLAPFGSHSINLAAITAAICTGPEAHENPARRYVAGIACGMFYLIVGLFGATITVLFTALPPVFIAVLAGLALISAFTTGLIGLVNDTENLEAGVITFLTTASGIHFLGLGAAFWGLLLGGAAWFILRKKHS